MLSSGGIATVETSRRFPVRLIESGPAAGALAAAHFSRLIGTPRLLSFDMGGTTAKASLIDGGQPLVTREFEVARIYRFKKGSGLPVKVPVIEMVEIGAGGGSIARVDSLGLLKVGPDSAGADPGPACYGLGGREPTVTDADLLLGYLDPEFFLGGRMRLDVEAARRTIEECVARPLGLDLIAAAWGIHRVVNENMASAARIHGIERGKDVRSYPLFAFGGAGPVHAWGVMEILRSPRLIIPFGAGANSAFGLLAAPLAFDFTRTAYQRLDSLDWEHVSLLYREMEAEGRAILRASGVRNEEVHLTRLAEMRYVGQGHEVDVPVPPGDLGPCSLDPLTLAFEGAYRALYGRTAPGVAIEALNWRLIVSGPAPVLRIEGRSDKGIRPEAARKGERLAYFPEANGFRPTAAWDRYRLAPGMVIEGPAIVEERESTAIIGPGGRGRVDELLNLIVGAG